MPTYVYKCSEGHEVEQVRKIADRDSVEPCPKCSAESSSVIAPLLVRVPAVSTAPVGFPGAASWRDNYR
jgi:putative FmdB family regulatory protein